MACYYEWVSAFPTPGPAYRVRLLAALVRVGSGDTGPLLRAAASTVEVRAYRELELRTYAVGLMMLAVLC